MLQVKRKNSILRSIVSLLLTAVMLSGIALPVFAEGEKAVTDHSRYAVEFFYGDKEYVMSGGYDVMLSYLLEELGISGEIQSWSVSDPTLFDIFWGDEYGVIYDSTGLVPTNEGTIPWLLSLRPFDTAEWLKVVVDGVEYEITVTDDNTTQNVPSDNFYSDTVTTRLDNTVSVTADTYYQNASSTEVANPTLPTIVRQSQSANTIYDFAAGLPLSAIFIDETKLGKKLGTFALEPNENQDYTGLITRDPATNTVSYNPGQTVDRHLLNGAPTVLEGPLFSFTFDDAAILPNGTLANLKITYSNAQLFTDERLAVMEKVAQEALDAAQKELEDALTPAQKAAARAKIAAAQANLTASYHRGMVSLAQGSTLEYSHNDARNLTVANTSTGFSQAQVDAAKTAYENRIKKYQEQTDLGDIADGGINYPSLGKSLDVTYTVVDDEGHPINGDFIFAFVGINLERDPYAITANNGGRGLWWVNDEYPDMHFFNEQVAVTNNSIASDYIYVRPNNTMVEPINPNHNPPNESKRTGYFPQVVEATENGVQKTKFIANRGQSLDSNDGYYSSGFVTLATSGFTITAYGHSYGNGGNMNTQAYGSRRIWYRYISTTGPNGNIQTTSEGNYGGTLDDTKDPRTVINQETNEEEIVSPKSTPLDPGTYVVPEGKTVTYTLTPNDKYQISKLQVRNRNGAMQEITFNNGKPLHTMQPGQICTFRDAAYKLCTLTALENGKFTLEMPYAQHDEEVRVEWEPIKGNVTVKKETVDNALGSFSFKIRAKKDELVTHYNTGTAWENAIGSVWCAGTEDIEVPVIDPDTGRPEIDPDTGETVTETVTIPVYNTNCKDPDGNDMTPAAINNLATLIAGTALMERVEISGGDYLWKTDKKLSDLGIQFAGEDDDLFIGFETAASYVHGDILDDALNNNKKRIFFYNPKSRTHEETTYWNFNAEKEESDFIEHSFTLNANAEISFNIPHKYEYEVHEILPTGWELISIDGVKGASIAAASLTDEHYAFEHTFLNRKLPDLTVEKQTLPDGAQDTFVFTVEIKSLHVDAQTGTVLATAGVSEGVIGYSFENPGDPFAVDGIIVPSGSFGFGQNTQLDTVCNMLLDLSSERDIRLGAEEGTVDFASPETQALRDWAEAQTVDGTRTVQFAFASPSKEVQPYKLPAPFVGAPYDAGTGTYTFTLQGGETLTFPDIPYGYTYAVTEGDLPEDWEKVSETNASGTLDSDKTALFVNEKHGVFIPETGIYTDSLPYVLALGFIIICLTGAASRIRKRSRIDE